jgi:hypothetical protein
MLAGRIADAATVFNDTLWQRLLKSLRNTSCRPLASEAVVDDFCVTSTISPRIYAGLRGAN